MKTTSVILSVVLAVVVVPSMVFAQVTFYTDQAAWSAAVSNSKTFEFTASNVEKADEVTSPPSTNNTLLGPTLTFASTNTGLSYGFTLQALEPGADLVYNDGDLVKPSISIGKANIHEDDDWQVTITSGPPLTAFAFDLLGNVTVATGESFSVYGPGNVLLGSTTLIPTSTNQGSAFLGVVSSLPIERIHFDEDSNSVGDDIGVANFRFAPVESAVLAYWQFEEGSANAVATGTQSIIDSGPNGIHLTPSGGTPPNGPIYRSNTSASAPGSFLSLQFDGVNDRLSTPDNDLLDFGLTDNFTVEFFFQTTSTAERAFLQKQHNFSGTMLYQLWISSAGKVSFDIRGNVLRRATSPLSYNDGNWHHVAGVRDVAADEIRLYIDGQLVSTVSDTNTASLANNGELLIADGNISTSHVFFGGLIDEVRISSGALQPDDFIIGTEPPPTTTTEAPTTTTTTEAPTTTTTTMPPPVACNGFTATIEGTPDNDTLSGTPGRDVINGLGGDDVIRGFGGNDVICGDLGNDTLFGQTGNDFMDGGLGSDRCNGGPETDTAVNCETMQNVP